MCFIAVAALSSSHFMRRHHFKDWPHSSSPSPPAPFHPAAPPPRDSPRQVASTAATRSWSDAPPSNVLRSATATASLQEPASESACTLLIPPAVPRRGRVAVPWQADERIPRTTHACAMATRSVKTLFSQGPQWCLLLKPRTILQPSSPIKLGGRVEDKYSFLSK